MSSPQPALDTVRKTRKRKPAVEVVALPVSKTCAILNAEVKAYQQLVRACTRLTNQTKANLRNIGITEPTEMKSADGLRKWIMLPLTPETAEALAKVNIGVESAKSVLMDARNIKQKRIEELVMTLPVWQWAESIRGVGALSLGCVIGMTGDLSNYANPAKVWKRLGLGIVGGEAQKKTTNIEKAMAFGFSPAKRATVHVVGIGINMAAATKGTNGSRKYSEIYRSRKEYELTRQVNSKPITAMHADKRALRYMEKRFVRDLWCQWNNRPMIA